MSKTNYVCNLTAEQSEKLKASLQTNNWEFDQVPYSNWRARKNKTTVTSYTSGKLCVQGKETADLVQFVIEPEILKEVRFGYESELAEIENPEMFEPHGGIDESGKGDYFGPLVIAAVFVDKYSAKSLLEEGVQDSKNIKSDKKISVIAGKIKTFTNNSYDIITIGPQAYNRMYEKTGNINKILAWGHAKALENLLEKEPECKRAISDKFGNKSTVRKVLMDKGKKIRLDQFTKAESDIAVAAASILARDEFVKWMKKLSKEANIELPKGASAKVIDCACNILSASDENELSKYAKMHFKTTENAKQKLMENEKNET